MSLNLTGNFFRVLLLFMAWLILLPGLCMGSEPKAGDVINAQNAEQYKDYFPEFIKKYIVDGYDGLESPVPFTVKGIEPNPNAQSFIDASQKNMGKVTIGQDGTLQGYEAGLPFPEPREPDLALKIMWNNYYRFRGDDSFYPSPFLSTSRRKGGRVTKANSQILTMKYTGRTSVQPIPEKGNLNGLFSAQIILLLTPPTKDFSILSWRYADPKKSDDMWAYVPVLRRTIRMVSSERSNPIRGSTKSYDDMYGFDGKLHEFTYSLVGDKKALALMNQKTLGDQFPKGHPHPIFSEDPLELREAYLISVKPKDPRYPVSDRILWISKDIFEVLYGECYDKNGKLWKGNQQGFTRVNTAQGEATNFMSWSSTTDVKTDNWGTSFVIEVKLDSNLRDDLFSPAAMTGGLSQKIKSVY